ncbi:MAG: O-antigen ligase family protein [Thermoanaerobaculales bacterium]|nr:O-antigen ligase family protein [Thermoanaerobaculales bacterium]
MLSLRKHPETDSWRPRAWSELSNCAVGVVFVGVVLIFQPYGLDQFLLPKFLVPLVGVPLILSLMIGTRVAVPEARRDAILVGLAFAFLAWSALAPVLNARNRTLHGIGALEVVLMAVFFAGAIGARKAGPRAELWLIRLLAAPALIVVPLAVAQGLGVDPLRLVFYLSSSRPGRWQVLTTLGNPTWTAELVVLSLPLMLVALKGVDRLRGVWLWAVGLVFSIAVAVTGSRGSLVGIVVAVVVCWRLGLVPKVNRPRWVALWSVIVVGVLVAVIGVGRMGELKPVTGRFGLWAAGMHLVRQEPVTGSGLDHTALILPEGLEPVVAGLDPQYHRWLPTVLVDRLDQDILQIAVERGLPAALLLVLMWSRAVLVSFRRFREKGSAVDGAVVAVLSVFFVLSLISAPLHTPATAALFWIVMGLAATGLGSSSPEEERDGGRRRMGAAVVGAVVATGIALVVVLPILRMNTIAGTAHRDLLRGRFKDASQALKPVPTSAPWLTGASIDRSRALVAGGGAAEALVILADAERWAASEWIWATRARALDQLGPREEARRELEAGLKILPRSPVLLEAWLELFPE